MKLDSASIQSNAIKVKSVIPKKPSEEIFLRNLTLSSPKDTKKPLRLQEISEGTPVKKHQLWWLVDNSHNEDRKSKLSWDNPSSIIETLNE